LRSNRPIGLKPTAQTARDTRLAVEAMADCDLILFAGGDGTARDVAGCDETGQAMLGIPCGVKMHSGVFAFRRKQQGSPRCRPDRSARPHRLDEAEVMDIDEAALRAGHIAPELFGHARVPVARNRMQASKGGPRMDSGAALWPAPHAEVVAQMEPGTLYIIGPGTSAGAVMRPPGIHRARAWHRCAARWQMVVAR
jgi:predicted polyphosphate/ATP-dependent NAD kinase